MGAQAATAEQLVALSCPVAIREDQRSFTMNVISGAGSGAQGAMNDAAKKQIEEQMGEMAPGYIKPFFPCCGGPVGTMEKFSCAIPADKQDEAKSAIEKYKTL